MIVENVLDYFTDSYEETFHWPEMSAPIWDRRVKEYHLTFEQRSIGNLKLPTGRVVASDPLVFRDQPPFLLKAPTGQYEVILSIATISGIDKRVAFAMLKFEEIDHISSWEVLQIAARPGSLSEPTSHYSVDSGTGCFMDLSTQYLLNERLEDSAFDEFFCEELQKSYATEKFSWVNHSLTNTDENNIIAFSTGWGDGSYSTYAGFTSSKTPICFITDFEIVRYMDNTVT